MANRNHYPVYLVIENNKGQYHTQLVWANTFEGAVRALHAALCKTGRWVAIRHPETLEVIRYI